MNSRITKLIKYLINKKNKIKLTSSKILNYKYQK